MSTKVYRTSVSLIVVFLILLVGRSLFFEPQSDDSWMHKCPSKLKQLDGIKACWAYEHHKLPDDVPGDTELFGRNGYMLEKPNCPQGGLYLMGAVGERVSCSIHGDVY